MSVSHCYVRFGQDCRLLNARQEGSHEYGANYNCNNNYGSDNRNYLVSTQPLFLRWQWGRIVWRALRLTQDLSVEEPFWRQIKYSGLVLKFLLAPAVTGRKAAKDTVETSGIEVQGDNKWVTLIQNASQQARAST